jgi:hypothetical protein
MFNEDRHDDIKEATNFFEIHTLDIEIQNQRGQLETVYFPMLPYCKKEDEFIDTMIEQDVNRTSSKTKVESLMDM